LSRAHSQLLRRRNRLTHLNQFDTPTDTHRAGRCLAIVCFAAPGPTTKPNGRSFVPVELHILGAEEA
jgi:hypothetical protein